MNQFIKNYYDKTNTMIDNSPFNQDFKNMFIEMMNKSVINYDDNYLGTSKDILRVSKQVRHLMKRCQPLLDGHHLNLICQYVMLILAHGNNKFEEFNTLHDVNPTHEGYNIFNFMEKQYDWSLQTLTNPENELDYDLSKKLFSRPLDEDTRIKYELKMLIESKRDGRKIGKELSSVCSVLLKLNSIFNTYLVKMGIIYRDSNNHFRLTELGKQVSHNTVETAGRFVDDYHLSYSPKGSYIAIMSSLLDNISWVAHHPEFNRYYGLCFVQGIISYSRYQAFCNYITKPLDSVGDVINKHVKRTLALSPMTYTCCLMSLFDCLFLHKNLNKEQGFQISKTGLDCLKQLGQLDVTAKKFVKNPQ